MVNLKSYIIGFSLSLLLTVLAFVFVMQNLLSGTSLTILLIIFAIIQASVQLYFFLHLTSGPAWDKAIFIMAIGIVLITVVGSLWIMDHLNYNMMPEKMQHEMMKMENMYK